MGTRDAPSREYTESGSGSPEVVEPVPLPILYHARSLTLNFRDSTWGYYPTVTDKHLALKLVEPTDIKMHLIFRIKSSPSSTRKQGIRQSTVYAHYKTFQMVYCLDAKRRLEKPTNDMINAVRKPCLKEPKAEQPVTSLV